MEGNMEVGDKMLEGQDGRDQYGKGQDGREQDGRGKDGMVHGW